jgi:ribonuclease T1
MGSARTRAAVAGVVALLVAAGIVVPGLGDDGNSGGVAAPEAPPAGTSEAPAAAEGEAIGDVLAAIESGAPLPYEEDGGVFQNREGLLPEQPLGYYREYTVETPGSADRGARRLVIGEGGETYYTDDHYASFTQIDPEDYR